MAKDSGNTKLWKGNGLRIDEINSVLNAGSGNLGALCTSNNINPWAKYKPFRNSSKGFSSTNEWRTAMRAAGWGFGAGVSNVVFTAGPIILGGNTPEWISKYEKPRGVLSNNEPYRQLDFADVGSTVSQEYGYYHLAACPMTIEFFSGGTYLDQRGDGIDISFDSEAYTNQQKVWSSDTCLSINDLMTKPIDTERPYNLAVLFHNLDSYTDNINLLVTNITPSDFTQNHNVLTVAFTGDSTETNFPYIPAIGTGKFDGERIRTILCLVEDRAPQGQNRYRVLDGNDAGSCNLVSLNLQNRMDDITAPLRTKDSILGTESEIYSSLSTGDIVDKGTYSHGSSSTHNLIEYRVFEIRFLKILFSVLGPEWVTRTGLFAQLFIEVNYTGSQDMTMWFAHNYNDDPYYDYETADGYPVYEDEPTRIINKSSAGSDDDDPQRWYCGVGISYTDKPNLPVIKTAMSYGDTGANGIKRPYLLIGRHENTDSAVRNFTITISGILFTNSTNPESPQPAPNGVAITPKTITFTY